MGISADWTSYLPDAAANIFSEYFQAIAARTAKTTLGGGVPLSTTGLEALARATLYLADKNTFNDYFGEA